MNLFDAIASLHSDVAKFAYRDLGSAAAMHEVIGVRNHLAKLKAGTVDENGDPVLDDDLADEQRGEEFEGEMRTEQGNPPAQPPLHRAEYLHDIRRACTAELKALGVAPRERREDETKAEYLDYIARFRRWNFPQNPADVLRFLSSTDGNVPETTAASFNRLVEKKILTRDQADEAIRNDKRQQAKRWEDVASDILVEIDGIDETDVPDGADAFGNLEPWMGLKLYDNTIKRLKGSCSRFVANVALGKLERSGIAATEAEAIAFLYQKEQDRLVQARAAFYKLHAGAIEANARATVEA